MVQNKNIIQDFSFFPIYIANIFNLDAYRLLLTPCHTLPTFRTVSHKSFPKFVLNLMTLTQFIEMSKFSQERLIDYQRMIDI